MMFYIVKDGLFFAGFYWVGMKMKIKWENNLAYIFKERQDAEESQQEVGGEIKTFIAT